MNLVRVLLAALLGLFSTSLFAFAEEVKKPETISTESAVKQYVVTFHDEVTADDFSDVSKWITENHGEIVESINENFAKLIIAKSDPSICKIFFYFVKSFIYAHFCYLVKLAELKPNSVESVEEDDLDWNDHVDL